MADMDNTENDDLSGLSDEERGQLLAMGDDDDGFSNEQLQSVIDDGVGAVTQPTDDGNGTQPSESTEGDVPALEVDVLPQAPMPADPVFHVVVPEGAAERLKAIEQAQQALATALEDGDIDMGEFFAKNNAMNNESIKLNIALEQASFAQQQNENLRAARWQWIEEQFMSNQSNQIYRSSPIALDALNAAIRRVSSEPKNAGKPDEWYLQEADRAVREAFNIQSTQRTDQSKAQERAEKKRSPDLSGIPPSLGSMPSADSNSVGEFGYLDRLSGMELEIAVNKLTPEQQERYLNEV